MAQKTNPNDGKQNLYSVDLTISRHDHGEQKVNTIEQSDLTTFWSKRKKIKLKYLRNVLRRAARVAFDLSLS